tara:strand:+ start:52 stop:741 length:690 start_codon:yes stop_codon:yes gene_type:complete
MATALTQTTLSGAISASQTTIPVASATGITAPVSNITQQIYVLDPDTQKGELMDVVSVNGTQIAVSRLSEYKAAHASGALVIIGVSPANPYLQSFQSADPVGVVAAAAVSVTPWINVTNGRQWLRGLSGVWVAGWCNELPKGVCTAVASAAGAVLPTGPLFHMTGTEAVTGFTIPVGFSGGSFTVVNDAAWTWTAAGNIGDAGTAVALETITFTWDSSAAKFYSSHLAA